MQEFHIPKTASKLHDFIQGIACNDGKVMLNGAKAASKPISFLDLVDTLNNYYKLGLPNYEIPKELDTLMSSNSEQLMKFFINDYDESALIRLENSLAQRKYIDPIHIKDAATYLRNSLESFTSAEVFIKHLLEYTNKLKVGNQAIKEKPGGEEERTQKISISQMERITEETIQYNKMNTLSPRNPSEERARIKKIVQQIDCEAISVGLSAVTEMYNDLLAQIENARALISGIALRAENIASQEVNPPSGRARGQKNSKRTPPRPESE